MANWGYHPETFLFERSNINPSVDEQSLDQVPERSRAQGYHQPFDQLANPLPLLRSMFFSHHLPPHLILIGPGHRRLRRPSFIATAASGPACPTVR